MSTKQHIIFDLDGTLIDSKPEIISTYKKVFEEIVPPHEIEYEEINYGNTLTAILEKVYNQHSALIEKAKLLFSEIYCFIQMYSKSYINFIQKSSSFILQQIRDYNLP
jgi:phosphoglycolate phosphatase-like HAD superfamily hydrolase